MKFKDWQFIDDSTKKPAKKPVQATPPKEETPCEEQGVSAHPIVLPRENTFTGASQNPAVHYVKDTKKNSLDLYFDTTHSQDTIKLLRKNGWLLFSYKNCWHNKLTPENEAFAKTLCHGSIPSDHTEQPVSVPAKQPSTPKSASAPISAPCHNAPNQPSGSFDFANFVAQYPDLLGSRAKLAAGLHDLFPTERYKTNLVLAVYDCGIANRIRTAKDLNSQLVGAFVRQLESDWGMKPENALQGVEIWATAFQLQIPKSQISNQPPKSNQEETSFSSKVVYAPSSEYKIYTYKRSGEIEIEKFLGFDKSQMVVPNIIDGKAITRIGMDAFCGCKNMVSLVIPSGIKRIGTNAFRDCSLLKSIDFGENVEHIGDEAFSNCISLSSINLPASLKCISSHAFDGCKILQNVNLNNGLESIEEGAFCNCPSLKRILIPNTVKEFGDCIFDYYNSNHDIYTERPDFIIYCYAGSDALAYARENGYTVKNADDWPN